LRRRARADDPKQGHAAQEQSHFPKFHMTSFERDRALNGHT